MPPPTAPPRPKFTTSKPAECGPKLVLYAPESWGKTNFVCHAPGAAIIQCGETGYDTLVNVGSVPQIMSARANNLPELYGLLDDLIASPGECKALGIDALGVIETWLQEVVVARDFNGDWNGPKEGFRAWGQKKGDECVARELNILLSRLERLASKGVTIVILSHTRNVKEKNNEGAEYGITHPDICIAGGYQLRKWADAILYGEFQKTVLGGDFVQEGKAPAKKGKAVGGDERIVHTVHNAAYVAKNRYGMPSEIELKDIAPEQVWGVITGYFKKGS